MSRVERIRWGCCDDIFEVRIWKSINRELTPGVLEELAMGKLNNIVCPKCGFSMQSPWPVLFNDGKKSLWVWGGMITGADGAEETPDPINRTGYVVLKADDAVLAAQVLIALDQSDLPAEIRTGNPSLKDCDVYAQAFKILYQRAKQA